MTNVGRGALLIAAVVLNGCDEGLGYDSGYDDGYAATYNTECKIRSTLIAGEWDNEKYSRGYSAGSQAASYDVATKGCKLY